MEALVLEWLNLIGRWVHVIAAIMWIGDSFLFMWMDSSLTAPSRPRDGAVAGELWMVHSGGFYEVVKRRYLAPNEMPAKLHWFKWQSYATFLSGVFLLIVVYYFTGSAFLIDPAVSHLSRGAAIGISIAIMVGGWFVYDGLWMSALAQRSSRAAAAVSCALIVVLVYALTHLYSGRAAYLLTGATIGTIMAYNVWRRIIPAQNQMLAATKAGTTVDTSLGLRAKQRSIHNHYVTLPVLFTMLSNHFPSTYGHPLNWVVLLLVMVVGVVIKYAMNFGARSKLVLAVGAAALVVVVGMTVRAAAPVSASGQFANAPPVPFAEAHAIIERRCLNCHALKPSNPAFPQPPNGIILEDPRRIRQLAPRIMVRAVVTKTMPLGNLTGMTEEERRILGAWIAQGAKTE